MTRRPGSDPDLLVSSVDRDTWQGMANARVPSAFPIDRFRIPDPQRRPPEALRLLPDEIVRLSLYNGAVTAAGGSKTVTLLAGDAAAVVLWGSPLASITLPTGWTVMESFDTTLGFGSSKYLIASITNAPAGDHTFTYSRVGGVSGSLSVTLVGHILRRGGGGSVSGAWHHIHGPHRINLRSFSFQTPDPSWAIMWQDSVCSAIYTGLQDLPYAPPGTTAGFSGGEGAMASSYEWPRWESPTPAGKPYQWRDIEDFKAGAYMQPPAIGTAYAAGGANRIYAFGSIGAYGVPGSVALAFGWTP